MNKNLKTLKDITLQYNPNHTSGEPIVCSIDSLKRIAREWIKEYETRIVEMMKRCEESKIIKPSDYIYEENGDNYIALDEDVVNWIKFFFNLE